MLERDVELGRLATAVGAAAQNKGRLVVIRGQAGIGKSSLLRAAADHAGAAGMTVLSARAGPLERDFPFGVTLGLFEPAILAASTAPA